jgi:UDP-N-acetyl-D-glucosamine dehydrogenase
MPNTLTTDTTSVTSLATSLRVLSNGSARNGDVHRAAGGAELLRSGKTWVVGIVGLGYVGLPTALALAESGNHVIGYDVSVDRLAAITRDDVDLLDTDHERLRRHVNTSDLRLTSTAQDLAEAEVLIICVPTPVDEHLVPDLRALSSACATVVAHARPGQLILLTSTTYVGTTRDLLVEPLAARGLRVGQDVFVAFAPERIDPGVSAHAQETTPRVVGGVTSECANRAVGVLRVISPLVHVVSSAEAAEMTKLLENSFRAVNIALANEMADVCRTLSLDVVEIIEAAATKPYGFMPFYPGPGVGGHCIPCDPHYLLWQLRAQRVGAPLVDKAMTAIAARPAQVAARVERVIAETGRSLVGARVLLLGVSYKPSVADLRESPALEIMERLRIGGAQVFYSDPYVGSFAHAGILYRHVERPEEEIWDAVLVHTLHPDMGTAWLETSNVTVLDASYRLTEATNRAVV